MLDNWLPFLIYATFAILIPSTMIAMSFAFSQRPARRLRSRTIPFESGVSTGAAKQRRFTVSFYLTALLFILFDIEIVFLYPLAVILPRLGWLGVVGLLFLLVVLALVYVHPSPKGALRVHADG